MEGTETRSGMPTPCKSFDVATADGAVIRVRQHGRPDGLRLVLSHGNGLAIDGYLPFWGPLCERYQVVVFDLRNHGRNPLSEAAGHTWANMANDMEVVWQAIGRELGPCRTAGVFHSLSAVVAAIHALEFGPRCDLLVLFEPPILPPPGHPLSATQQGDKKQLATRALRRVDRYPSPDDLARQFATRAPFRRWVPGAAEAMARAVLRLDGSSGSWVLACPKELEARIFATASDSTLWKRMGSLGVPTKLVGGDPDLEGAVAPTLIARALASDVGIEYEAVPDATHFLQIERPDQCVRAMESFFAAHGLAA